MWYQVSEDQRRDFASVWTITLCDGDHNDQNNYSPPLPQYLIVRLGENTKARSDSLPGRGTSRDEALLIGLTRRVNQLGC